MPNIQITKGAKITHYKLVVESAAQVEEKVTELIQQDWQPYGSPFVLPPTPELAEQVDMVFQAMVKYASS